MRALFSEFKVRCPHFTSFEETATASDKKGEDHKLSRILCEWHDTGIDKSRMDNKFLGSAEARCTSFFASSHPHQAALALAIRTQYDIGS